VFDIDHVAGFQQAAPDYGCKPDVVLDDQYFHGVPFT
jgi:hypothetical protein